MKNPHDETPIRVDTYPDAGSSIRVPVVRLEELKRLLKDNEVPHWAEHLALSINGGPAYTVVHIRQRCDPHRVQAILDAVA